MVTKKPTIKETVGALYYAFNTPTEQGDFSPATYEETIKSDVVKQIGTTENSESTTVRASGTDYATFNKGSNVDHSVEVIAINAKDLARMRGDTITESGLVSSGRATQRPYFAFGKVVLKVGEGFQYAWYPKCQLVENTDETKTSEENFAEQNETLTIRAFAFNDNGDIRNYIDSDIDGFPKNITETKFFTKVIISSADLVTEA